jgi:hypothetical protein
MIRTPASAEYLGFFSCHEDHFSSPRTIPVEYFPYQTIKVCLVDHLGVCMSVCVISFTPVFARQRLDKHVPAVMNTHTATEE